MPQRTMLTLSKGDKSHVIDNTDARSLSKSRLEYVYGAGDYEALLDVFYGTKKGHFMVIVDEQGNSMYQGVLE